MIVIDCPDSLTYSARMSEKPPRKGWGSGRIAFLARLPDIKSDIASGIPLTAIYARHPNLGITYRSFCRLVARYAQDAKPAFHPPPLPGQVRPPSRSSPALTPPSAPAPPVADRTPQGTTDAVSPEQGARFHSSGHITPALRRRIFGDE